MSMSTAARLCGTVMKGHTKYQTEAGMRVFLLGVAALVAHAVFWMPVERAFAEPVLFPDLTDSVAGREDVTFVDLVHLVAPGILAIGETASDSRIIDVRHIGGSEWSSPQPVEAKLLKFAVVPVRSRGMDRIVLLLDFGQAQDSASGFAVLALFGLAGKPRLIDAADVAFDRWISFGEPVWLPISEDGGLLITRSTHFNSSQGYATTALILLRNDRFELVDRIFTLDDRGCAFERTQKVGIWQGREEQFADIHATVTEFTESSGEQCGDAIIPEPGARTIAVTYHWDATRQRYFASSDAFAVLERENEQRF